MTRHLTRDIVVASRRRAPTESIAALAKEFDVNANGLAAAVRGATWEYVDTIVAPVPLGRERSAQFGAGNAPSLTEDQVLDARRRVRGGEFVVGETITAIAKDLGASYMVTYMAVTGRTWRRLNDVEAPVTELRRARGEDHPNATLTEEQIRAIRDLANQRPLGEVADAYQISLNYTRMIVDGKAWSHVA